MKAFLEEITFELKDSTEGGQRRVHSRKRAAQIRHSDVAVILCMKPMNRLPLWSNEEGQVMMESKVRG